MDCKGFKRANKPFYQGPGSQECREMPIKHPCSSSEMEHIVCLKIELKTCKTQSNSWVKAKYQRKQTADVVCLSVHKTADSFMRWQDVGECLIPHILLLSMPSSSLLLEMYFQLLNFFFFQCWGSNLGPHTYCGFFSFHPIKTTNNTLERLTV